MEGKESSTSYRLTEKVILAVLRTISSLRIKKTELLY